MIGSAGRICFKVATQSIPDIPGNRISISTTSGFLTGTSRIASSPDAHAPPHRIPGAEFRIFTSCSRNPRSSSTTITDLAIPAAKANPAAGPPLAHNCCAHTFALQIPTILPLSATFRHPLKRGSRALSRTPIINRSNIHEKNLLDHHNAHRAWRIRPRQPVWLRRDDDLDRRRYPLLQLYRPILAQCEWPVDCTDEFHGRSRGPLCCRR